MPRPPAIRTPSAVGYARVSSREQEKEGYSIPAQQKLLAAYAAEKGIAVLREFVDVETAKQFGRAAFGEMVQFLKRTKSCRAILVEKTDRLYRNFKDYVLLDDLDVELHFVKEGTVLSRDSRSSEKFVHGIKVLMAKNYIDNLSEETRKGMAEKAAQGAYPTRCPLGYRNVTGADGRKAVEPDPAYAPLVAHLFEWYATGSLSLSDLVAKAHDAGFIYKGSRKPVSRAAIHTLLKNRMFTGRFVWKGAVHQGNYPPLVTEELWEKVQAILRGRNRKKTRKGTRTFAFTRLISCGHCGCAQVGEEKKRKYVYYHCTGFKGKCPEPFVREEVLEERFTAVLRRIAFDDEVIALVADALRESHKDQRRFHEEAIARLRAEQTKLQNRIDGAYEDKLDGKVTADFFERKTADWRAEQGRLAKAVAQHQQANQSYLEEGVRLLELARRAADLFAAQPAGEKRRLLDFVLSNCTWAGGELAVEFRQPFDLLAVAANAVNEKKAAGGSPGGLCPEKLPERNTVRTHSARVARESDTAGAGQTLRFQAFSPRPGPGAGRVGGPVGRPHGAAVGTRAVARVLTAGSECRAGETKPPLVNNARPLSLPSS